MKRASRASSISASRAPEESDCSSPGPLTLPSYVTSVPSTAPLSHRRLRSGVHRTPHSRTPSSNTRSLSASDNDERSNPVDPFATFLFHHRSLHGRGSSSSPLSFTASLAMRRAANVAKVLSNVKKSPLLNPPRAQPVSAAPGASLSMSLSPAASFQPHLNLLAHHPSVALLTYPPGAYLTYQSSHTSLVKLIVSGRVRMVRNGVVCAEVERGGLIGAESAIMSSERYRRYRRRMRRRRLKKKQSGEERGVAVHGAEEERRMAEEVDRHQAEDERELQFDVEDSTGRKRRRLRLPQQCTAQCVDSVECVVFPASVLRSHIDSDRALLSHAFRWITAVHWTRRQQWKDGERRLHLLWGGQRTLEQAGLAAEAQDEGARATALDRRVLGSAGFVYFGLLPAPVADEERMRHFTHEQNVGLEHPMFAHGRGEGGGPVERRRLRVKAAGARNGDRQQKAEMKKAKDKEEKARKVRKIIDAIERKRRDVAREAARRRGAADDPLYSDEEDDDDLFESDEDEDDDDDPLQDERYAAAVNVQQLHAPLRSRKGSRGSSPRLRALRRLPIEQLQAPRSPDPAQVVLDVQHLQQAALAEPIATEGAVGAAMEVRVLPATPRAALQPAWEDRTGEEAATDLPVKERTESARRNSAKRPATAPVDSSFLRPGTPSTARQQREGTARLLSHWQENEQRTHKAASRPSRRSKEERRLEEEAQMHTHASPLPSEPVVGIESIEPIDYTATRGRWQAELEEAKKAEAEARRTTGELVVDSRGVALVAGKKNGGAVRSAVRSLTGVERMVKDAEQRYGREERHVLGLLHWTSERVRTEDTQMQRAAASATLAATARAPERPAEAAFEEGGARLGTTEELEIEVLDNDDEEEREVPIPLSPPALPSSSFRLFHQLPADSRTQQATGRRTHTARPATAGCVGRPPLRPSVAPADRFASRPSTAASASSVRASLLHRQRRSKAVVAESVQSLLSAVGNRGLGWQLRVRMLQEADALHTAQTDRAAADAETTDREGIAAALSGPERFHTAKVSMGSLGGVRAPAVTTKSAERGGSPARPQSAPMRKYAVMMAERMGKRCGSAAWR